MKIFTQIITTSLNQTAQDKSSNLQKQLSLSFEFIFYFIYQFVTFPSLSLLSFSKKDPITAKLDH